MMIIEADNLRTITFTYSRKKCHPWTYIFLILNIKCNKNVKRRHMFFNIRSPSLNCRWSVLCKKEYQFGHLRTKEHTWQRTCLSQSFSNSKLNCTNRNCARWLFWWCFLFNNPQKVQWAEVWGTHRALDSIRSVCHEHKSHWPESIPALKTGWLFMAIISLL